MSFLVEFVYMMCQIMSCDIMWMSCHVKSVYIMSTWNHIYIHIYIYMYIHIYIHTCIHVYTYIYVYVCMCPVKSCHMWHPVNILSCQECTQYVNITSHLYSYIYIYIHTHVYTYTHISICIWSVKSCHVNVLSCQECTHHVNMKSHIYSYIYIHESWHTFERVTSNTSHSSYGLATISRLLENIGLFCKRTL